MSASILYHCFEVTGRGYRYIHARLEEGQTFFQIDQNLTLYRYPACGSSNVKRKGDAL
jgi:hypothetical protein